MSEEQDENLLNKIAFTGRVVRCTVEPIDTDFYRGSGVSHVTVEVERPKLDTDGAQFRLSITTAFKTDGLTLEQIQGFALEHAKKLIEHTQEATQ